MLKFYIQIQKYTKIIISPNVLFKKIFFRIFSPTKNKNGEHLLSKVRLSFPDFPQKRRMEEDP